MKPAGDSRRNLKLTVAYDGSGYHGFQRQLNALTVQQVLEEKLSALLGEPVAVAGAARTDAGVHAYGQVISLRTAGAIPVDRIPAAARGILPRDIAVLSAATVPSDFHARFSATGKIYLYRILNSPHPDPIMRNYVWQVERALDDGLINQALAMLVGENHFGAFQASAAPPEIRCGRFMRPNASGRRSNWNFSFTATDFCITWFATLSARLRRSAPGKYPWQTSRPFLPAGTANRRGLRPHRTDCI